MPVFRYVARDRAGKQVRGAIEARGIDSAQRMLRKQDLFVVKIGEESGRQRWLASAIAALGLSQRQPGSPDQADSSPAETAEAKS